MCSVACNDDEPFCVCTLQMEVAESRGSSSAQMTATTYHKVMERLKYLCRWASNLGTEDADEWCVDLWSFTQIDCWLTHSLTNVRCRPRRYDSMERISARIYRTPELQHVDIYNQLGMVNAEAGNFEEAIKTFRDTLKIDANDHLAMEQLGNLLVRSAFQVRDCSVCLDLRDSQLTDWHCSSDVQRETRKRARAQTQGEKEQKTPQQLERGKGIIFVFRLRPT